MFRVFDVSVFVYISAVIHECINIQEREREKERERDREREILNLMKLTRSYNTDIPE